MCRRKALLALSCLTRHNDAAMDAFRAEGALDLLLSAARDSADPRQRRCGGIIVTCSWDTFLQLLKL